MDLEQIILTTYGDKYPDGLIPPGEAANIVKMSSKTLASMRSRGSGPPWIKSGSKVYYTLGGLAKWFAERSKMKL